MLAFAAHTSYQKRFNKVLSFVVMGASEDFLHVTTVVYEIMSVCMRVKQQTDDLYIIICNCIYIVVINCGWNNNVAVKIVACWNWNIFTSSSWLARHSGPHLRNERTTEIWAYGRFCAKLGIYQYGRERWLRSNLTSGLSSCTQVFELAWICVQHREFRIIILNDSILFI